MAVSEGYGGVMYDPINEEYIKKIEKENTDLRKQVEEMREGLKRLQYLTTPNFDEPISGSDETPIPLTVTCIGCGESINTTDKKSYPQYPVCKPDCWLSKLIGGK